MTKEKDWATARLTPELAKKLTELARVTQRSKSAVMRILISLATPEIVGRPAPQGDGDKNELD